MHQYIRNLTIRNDGLSRNQLGFAANTPVLLLGEDFVLVEGKSMAAIESAHFILDMRSIKVGKKSDYCYMLNQGFATSGVGHQWGPKMIKWIRKQTILRCCKIVDALTFSSLLKPLEIK